MIISGIYKIQSKTKPERCYVGSAIDIERRWKQHLDKLRLCKHHSQKLQRHYNKYGKLDLQFSILIGCDKENLIPNEQFFIDSYSPYFNGSKKAVSPGNFKLSFDARRKISNATKGKNHPRFGKHCTEEHKKMLSELKKGNKINLGRVQSAETRRKISEARKGKPNPHLGFKHTEETRKKISAITKGMPAWNKGIPISKEASEKLSKSLKEYHRLKSLNFNNN